MLYALLNPEDSLLADIDQECSLENDQTVFAYIRPMDVNLSKFRDINMDLKQWAIVVDCHHQDI